MLDQILSWDTLWAVLTILYVPACICLIVIVLLQKGKGAGFAGSFGMGAGPGSDAVFGPKAGQSLPVRLTYVAATIFILISVVMSVVSGRVGKGSAPELIEDAGTTIEATTGLSNLGIGTGKAGSATTTQNSGAAGTPTTTQDSPTEP